MRKFLIAVCALGLMFSAAGCGNSSESSAKAETKEVDESKNLDLLKKGFNSITKEEWPHFQKGFQRRY
ncbi:hypothetical protein [Bacillus atrophaeus]